MDNNKQTLIMKIIKKDINVNNKLFKLLLKHGVDINIKDENGNNLLMISLQDNEIAGNVSEKILLLIKYTKNLNEINNNGYSALMIILTNVCKYNQCYFIKLLMNYNVYMNADQFNIINEKLTVTNPNLINNYLGRINKIKQFKKELTDNYMNYLNHFKYKPESMYSKLLHMDFKRKYNQDINEIYDTLCTNKIKDVFCVHTANDLNRLLDSIN